ncbi:MAG: diguanylate cyclase, partial [Pseudomonadota bacterium]
STPSESGNEAPARALFAKGGRIPDGPLPGKEYALDTLRRFAATLLHPDCRERLEVVLRRAIEDGHLMDLECRARVREDAPWRWYRLTGRLARRGSGTRYVSGALQDIDGQRCREDELMELSIAVEHAMQGISRVDADGTFVEVRDNYAAMLGYEPHELIGQPWVATVAAAHREQANAAYEEMLATGVKITCTTGLRKDGAEFDKQLLLVKRVDEAGKLEGHYCFMRDVTDELAMQQALAYEASHDGLTRLLNRREFEQRLVAALDDPGPHVLCYFDLDQFKVINDTLGHAAGDHLLQELAGELRDRTRAQDTLARLGGDEFAVLFTACSVDRGQQLAEAIRATIEGFESEWHGVP